MSPRGVGEVGIRVEPRAGLTPLPHSECAAECHHRGTCAALFNDQPAFRLVQCLCHAGFSGSACEFEEPRACINSCSSHGRCLGRLCLCQRGWHGLDCSLSRHSAHAPARTSPASGLRYVPTYVYPLPTDVAMLQASQGSRGAPGARGTFQANRVYLEMLHARQDAIVSDPRAASLFVVPLMLTQRRGNMWEPQQYMAEVIDRVRMRWPFWNRSNGEDHIMLTTQDYGGCMISPAARRAIIVSHFGFEKSMPQWMNVTHWRAALDGTSASTSVQPATGERGALHRPDQPPGGGVGRSRPGVARWELRARSWEKDDTPGCARHQREKGTPLPALKSGCSRHQGPCFDAKKDVVIPTDFVVPEAELRATQAEAAEWRGCGSQRVRRKLLFLAGSLVDKNVPWYSQLVRQEFQRLHANDSAVEIRVGAWSIGDLRDADYCLSPSGVGFGWRVYVALAALCVPVIVQPMVHQAFDDLAPFDLFSLSFPLSDVKRLPQLLRAVPPETLCMLRENAARYFPLFLWQTPGGLAYDMLQLSLCRRSLQLHQRAERAERVRRGGRRAAAPPWAACARMTAEELLKAASLGGGRASW